MQRSKPWRTRPTPHFMNLLDLAMNARMFLVHETGPTRLVLQTENRKKYKVQIGYEVSCSCGGGRTEHCVHTIFALVKIFRIDELSPLVWQLSFIDSEISKIIQNRHNYMNRMRRNESDSSFRPPRYVDNSYAAMYEGAFNSDLVGGGGGAGHQQQRSAGPKKKTVERMDLEPETPCCICHEDMKDDENLTYCKFSCGQNLHVECAEHWVKHKMSINQKVTCPLCRTDWGQDALAELKKETRVFKEKVKEKKEEEKKERAGPGGLQPQQPTDRSF